MKLPQTGCIEIIERYKRIQHAAAGKCTQPHLIQLTESVEDRTDRDATRQIEY